MRWVVLALGLLYALSPVDLLPDLLPGWGWLDDLLLIFLLWQFYLKKAFRWGREPEEQPRGGRSRPDEGFERPAHQASPEADPYRVLGIAPGASPAEIQDAYRRMAARYHPDKVAHLGEEFQALAEEKFKTIQQAYEKLR